MLKLSACHPNIWSIYLQIGLNSLVCTCLSIPVIHSIEYKLLSILNILWIHLILTRLLLMNNFRIEKIKKVLIFTLSFIIMRIQINQITALRLCSSEYLFIFTLLIYVFIIYIEIKKIIIFQNTFFFRLKNTFFLNIIIIWFVILFIWIDWTSSIKAIKNLLK